MCKVIQFPTERVRRTETAVPDPMVGVEVYFTGDLYNQKGYGKITEVRTSGWGTSYHVAMDEGEDFWLESNSFIEAYEGIGNNLIMRKAVYEGWRQSQSKPRLRFEPISRDQAVEQIKTALKRRSGRTWSVTGDRGTAWGWITIHVPPKRRNGSYMSDEDAEILSNLLDLSIGQCRTGVNIAASPDWYWEYIDRANGVTPRVYGKPYWD